MTQGLKSRKLHSRCGLGRNGIVEPERGIARLVVVYVQSAPRQQLRVMVRLGSPSAADPESDMMRVY